MKRFFIGAILACILSISASAGILTPEKYSTDPVVAQGVSNWQLDRESFSQSSGPATGISLTNLPAVSSPIEFINEGAIWLSSFNPNNHFAGTVLEFSAAADFESGEQWANDLDLQWDPSGGNWIAGGWMRNAGIGGVVESAGLEGGYSIWTYLDTRAELKLRAGFNNQYSCATVEPMFELRKLVSQYAFLGIYISEPFLIQKNLGTDRQFVPNIGAETGFIGGAPITTASASARWSHHFYALKKLVSPQSY